MRFLAIGTWDAANPLVAELRPRERERSAELRQQGLVEQLLLRADGTGAFLILDAESADAAHQALATLPFVEREVMRVELIALRD